MQSTIATSQFEDNLGNEIISCVHFQSVTFMHVWHFTMINRSGGSWVRSHTHNLQLAQTVLLCCSDPRVIGHMCAATRSFYCLCIVLDRFPSTTNKLDKGLPDVATANVYKAPSIHIDIVYERNMLEMIYFSKHNARASSFLVNSLWIERIIAVEVCLICSSWQCEHVILLPTSNERSLKQTLIMSTASRVYNCI